MMRNITTSILIFLLFNYLLMGCSVFRKGDCGCDENTCAAPGEPGHGRWEFMIEPGITLDEKLKMLEADKRQRDEAIKRALEESTQQLDEQTRQISEQTKKNQELAKEKQEHDLKFKNGKVFNFHVRNSNVEEARIFLEFIKEEVEPIDTRTRLDEQRKQDISNLFNDINQELKAIQAEIGGMEKCLNMVEKSPLIDYEKEKKDLELAKQLVKELEKCKGELCTLLAARRKELNNPELEAAYREKTTLHEAALAGDLEMVQKNLSRGISIQLTTSAHQTALHCVALSPQPSIVVADWLLQRGIPTDALDNQGNTALSLAVEKGHLDLVKLLMKAGASFKHPKNWSLLHWAAYKGQLAVVKYLVEEAKIFPLIFDSEGNTALILALSNKHEAVVSYLREYTKRDLPTFYSNVKENVKKHLGVRLAAHVKGICEYAGTNPAYVDVDCLINSLVETMQAIAEKGEAEYAIPSNNSQGGASTVQPQVNEALKDLLNELKRYAPNLPESSQKEMDKLSVEKLRPHIAALVKQIDEVKVEIASFSQGQDKQTQKRVERIKTDTEKLQQQMQQLEQAAEKEEVQKRKWVESQKQHELATKNIAVPSVKYYFIPEYRCSNVEEIKNYLEFIQEDIAQNPNSTPLTIEQQQDLQSLLQQIAKEEQELAISYRDLKNYADHRGGDQVFLEEAKQKEILGEEAIKVEVAFINRKLENTRLAKQLLDKLQLMKKEAYELLKNNQEDVSNYLGIHQHEATFENDYSKQELADYISSYGLEDPHTKNQLYIAFFKDKLMEAVAKELTGKAIIDRAVLERVFQEAYQLAEKAQVGEEAQFFGVLKKHWVLALQHILLKSYKTKMEIGLYSEIFNDVYRQTAQVWNAETQSEQAFIVTLRDMFQHSAIAVLQKIGTQEPIDKSYIQAILQVTPLKADIEKYYPSHQVMHYRDRHSYVTGLVLHSLFTAVPVSLERKTQHRKLNDVKKQVHRLHVGVSECLK